MRTILRTTVLAAALTGVSGAAHAAPARRVQVNQHGDFLLVGNTLGYECATGTPMPVVGTIASGACSQGANTNTSDSSPDLYWSADTPSAGQCTADITFTASQARTTAMLTVPAGATVTHAFLYWSATNTTGVADTQVTLDRVGAGGFGPTTVTAIQSWVPGVDNAYQSVADVTALVAQYGSGTYRVSDVDVAPFANVDASVLYGGWWMVVFYELASDPVRNLALFDGLDVVKAGSNQSVTLSGFLVPNAGFDGKLGVAAFEGDAKATGDGLQFNNQTLSNAQNPADNFFNATRSWLGNPVSVTGDLPQLTGTQQSMAGVDLDVVDITAYLTQGQTSAPVTAITAAPVGDTYYLGGFVTSISTFAPDFSTSTKAVTDDDGGVTLAGDVLTYTITAKDSGNDASVQTTVSDPLPKEVTFVAGSITIDGVAQTDAAGDDRAEYDATSRTVSARLGTGANATVGGSIAAGAQSVVAFKVKVNTGVLGDVSNQATISAGGKMGAPVATVVTDGNGSAAGNPPTVITVNQCMTDGDCGGTMSGRVCDATDTCIDGCRGMGGNGCPTGMMCSSTTSMIGTCGPNAGSSSSSTSSSSSSTSSTSSSSSSTSSSSGAGGAGGAPTGNGGAGGGGDFVAVGNGVACNASPASSSREGGASLLVLALAGLLARRRRAS